MCVCLYVCAECVRFGTEVARARGRNSGASAWEGGTKYASLLHITHTHMPEKTSSLLERMMRLLQVVPRRQRVGVVRLILKHCDPRHLPSLDDVFFVVLMSTPTETHARVRELHDEFRKTYHLSPLFNGYRALGLQIDTVLFVFEDLVRDVAAVFVRRDFWKTLLATDPTAARAMRSVLTGAVG